MAEEFDNYARTYEEMLSDPLRVRFARNSRFYHQRKLDLLLELLRAEATDPRKMSWLDLGCGRGELLELGREQFGRIAGCDPSAEMLAGSPLNCLQLQTATAELPYKTSSFDLVTAVCVYHHVPVAARKALGDEVRRVLKPGAHFCIIEHNPWNPVARMIVQRCPLDRAAVLLSLREAVRTLGQSGFRARQRSYFLYLPEAQYRKFPIAERWLSRIPLGGQFAVLFRREG